ncbi:MAG TPA: hypothetical protein VGS28_04675 [Candidatus Saccharimonadales bacterium]|nr:hypothetical protein [Candidatus Saccharimonadales bacterium]
MSYEEPSALREPVPAYLTDFRAVALRAAMARAPFIDLSEALSPPPGLPDGYSREDGFKGFVSPAGIDVIDNVVFAREPANFEAMLIMAGYDRKAAASATRRIGTRLEAMTILGATAPAFLLHVMGMETSSGHPRYTVALGSRATFPERWEHSRLAHAAVLAYPEQLTDDDLRGIDALLGGPHLHLGVKAVGALAYWHNQHNRDTPLPVPQTYKPPRIVRILSRIPYPAHPDQLSD